MTADMSGQPDGGAMLGAGREMPDANSAVPDSSTAAQSASDELEQLTGWLDLPPAARQQLFDSCVASAGALPTITKTATSFWWHRREVAASLLGAETLKTTKADFNTVALYYHRLNNGGTEHVLCQMIDMLATMGKKLVVITDDPPHPQDYQPVSEFVRVVLPVPEKAGSDFGQRAAVLQAALLDQQVDLLICHAWMCDTILWDMLATKSLGIPYLIQTHNIFTFPALTAEWLYQYDMPAIYQLADAVVTLSRVDKLYWQAFNHNVHLVREPLDHPLPALHPEQRQALQLLWIGRISYEKNYQDIIPVMQAVCAEVPEAHLTIVGGSETPEELAAFLCDVEAAGLADAVTAVGFQANTEPYYRQASLLVSTALLEGGPLTWFEAIGYGLPCAVYDLPYLEILRDGRGFVTVADFNPQLLAAEIVRLLTNPSALAQLS
ncbi:MAG: glycosyltransferase family 4 protein, partial [Actinomycetia bacterium]|nr:glycosyltransferase family 4 protein [Actinomycetes bacterium]